MGCGDGLGPPCMTMPGPVPPEPREAGGDGDGAGCGTGQVLGSRAGHQPEPLHVSPVSFPPRQDQVLLTPPPRCLSRLPAEAPPSPVTTATLGKLRCARKGRNSPLHPRPGALHPTRSAGSRSLSQDVPPALTCRIHLDPWRDFNEGLFSCRGPWCYSGRGSPRRRLFPR